jgi:hypothetical protein
MDVLLSLLLSMGVTGSAGVSAKQTISTPTVATATAAKNPSSQEVQKNLGREFQFLLNAPPPSGGKVNPGDAQILRSLCGTCTPDQAHPWSTKVVTRKGGVPMTLADLYKMHQDGMSWRKISQRELGVKQGMRVRETASRPQVFSAPGSSSFSTSAGSGKSVESGIFTGANRSMDGSALLYGNGGERAGIVTGNGELVMDHSQGASSSGQGRGQ